MESKTVKILLYFNTLLRNTMLKNAALQYQTLQVKLESAQP